MKLTPRALVRGAELAAKTLPKNATPMEIAIALASPEVGVVPLRRRALQQVFIYEAVSEYVGAHVDPWAMPGHSARDVKRHAKSWAKADAVGITFPAGGPDYVLHPETRTLFKYMIEHT